MSVMETIDLRYNSSDNPTTSGAIMRKSDTPVHYYCLPLEMSVTKTCDLCQKSVDDPVELGIIMKKSDIQVHHYCLLISTHLSQRGKETSGILGFLIKDIRKEIKACKDKICFYCNDSNANAKCNDCDRYYHLVCGLKYDCLFQFVNEFKSFCHDHCLGKHKHKPNLTTACYICLEPIGTYNPVTSMTAKCCKSNWVHRRCMKEYALYSGYYLRCLWCRNTKFRDHARRLGIFVPDRDALPERKSFFQIMYKKYAKCDADNCLCDKGRAFKGLSAWKILVCDTCAIGGVHKRCLPKNTTSGSFQCKKCVEVLNSNTQLLRPKSRKRTREPLENEDEILDVSQFVKKSKVSDDSCRLLDQPLQLSGSIQQNASVRLPEKSVTNKCDLCHKNVNDPVDLGAIMQKSEIQVHYYCLLVSTHLPQRGKGKSGIMGFLLKDINKEIKACKKRICFYCKDSNANVKCNDCNRYYHLVCGLKNKCLFRFLDEFKSFCHDHCVVKHKKKPDPAIACYICLEPIGIYNPVTSLTAKCCKSNWVHIRCMKEYALYSGYYLQCLWCRNPKFRDHVRRYGVFVPDRDALRDRKGSFRTMYRKYTKCDADVCRCDKGRAFKDSFVWEMLVCDTCVVSGVHKQCLPEIKDPDNIQCNDCLRILGEKPQLSRRSILDMSLFMNKSGALCDDSHILSESVVNSPRSVQREATPKHKQFSFSRNESESIVTHSPSSKPSKIRPYICVDAKDKSKIECVLLDSDNNIIKREKIIETNLNDGSLHKQTLKVKRGRKLDYNAIELSDTPIEMSEDDDSERNQAAINNDVNFSEPVATSSKSKFKRPKNSKFVRGETV